MEQNRLESDGKGGPPDLPRDPALVEIVRRLVEAYQPERISLFGSKARGEAGPDSDYDILVLVEHPTEPLYRLSQRGFRALRGIAAAVDVVVWDRATFDARLHLAASFPATVVREGRLLHAARRNPPARRPSPPLPWPERSTTRCFRGCLRRCDREHANGDALEHRSRNRCSGCRRQRRAGHTEALARRCEP